MKLAYIVLAHKLPAQVVRLAQRLATPDTSLFVHVDKRTDKETYERIAGPLSARSNVHFLRRNACRWADFGPLRATLSGIREACISSVRFDYLILLTGQCYPIKSNQYIQEALQKSGGRSFINYFTLPHPYAKKWEFRILYWHINWWRWHIAFPQADADVFYNPHLRQLWKRLMKWIPLRRKFPRGFKPFYGGAYWCLSRECVEYVSEFVQHNRAFVDFFKNAFAPDEEFFQTILLNSTLRDRVVDDDLRYIDFSAHKAHPAILGKNDFNRFMSTGNLFARKFDATVDGEVLDMIDDAIS